MISFINKQNIFFFLLTSLLFFHWIDIKISGLIIIIFSLITFYNLRINCTEKEIKLYNICLSILFFILTVLPIILLKIDCFDLGKLINHVNNGFLNDGNCLNLRLILIYLNPCIIVISLISFQGYILKNIKSIALTFFLITTLSIIIEFILVNFFYFQSSLIPTFRDSESYVEPYFGIYSPFGLTGNSSMNGGLILLSLILINQLKMINWKIITIFCISNILTMGGQSFILAICYLNFLFFKEFPLKVSSNKKIFLSLFITLILYFISYSVLRQKINPVYIFSVIKNNLHFADITGLNLKYILFGTWGLNPNNLANIQTQEIFYLYQIREYGIIFSIIYYLIPFYFIKDSKYPIFNNIILVLSNLHYPTYLSFESQLILIMIYFSTKKINNFEFRKNNYQ